MPSSSQSRGGKAAAMPMIPLLIGLVVIVIAAYIMGGPASESAGDENSATETTASQVLSSWGSEDQKASDKNQACSECPPSSE